MLKGDVLGDAKNGFSVYIETFDDTPYLEVIVDNRIYKSVRDSLTIEIEDGVVVLRYKT